MNIVVSSRHLLAQMEQTPGGEITLLFLTNRLKEQEPEKAKKVLERVLKTVEVALIVEGLL
jgi:hypothetical protein